MPPAASPSVSVKIRLSTRPIPTDSMMISRAASVCILFSSIGEVGDNFLAEADDVPDPDDKRMAIRLRKHLFEHILRGRVHQVRYPRCGEPQGECTIFKRHRKLAHENKMIGRNMMRDQISETLRSLNPIFAAIDDHD